MRMSHMHLYVMAAALASLSLNSSAAGKEETAQATQEINQVVETFKAAIIVHDGPGLKALFLPDQSNWLSVAHEELYKKIREQHPDAPRIKQSSYTDFADFVATAKTPVEEKFYNVNIQTNGTIGTVYFDFDFLQDGTLNNRGAETWQLIKTEKGWKIAAMLYSSQGR